MQPTSGGSSYVTDALRAVVVFGRGPVWPSQIQFFGWKRAANYHG
jgi:hypothetical protein